MARQCSTHMSGPLKNNLNYYHNVHDGFLVRAKPGPQPTQVLHTPNFARTRENASEFKQATLLHLPCAVHSRAMPSPT